VEPRAVVELCGRPPRRHAATPNDALYLGQLGLFVGELLPHLRSELLHEVVLQRPHVDGPVSRGVLEHEQNRARKQSVSVYSRDDPG
jgi:hypothetical protein